MSRINALPAPPDNTKGRDMEDFGFLTILIAGAIIIVAAMMFFGGVAMNSLDHAKCRNMHDTSACVEILVPHAEHDLIEKYKIQEMR